MWAIPALLSRIIAWVGTAFSGWFATVVGFMLNNVLATKVILTALFVVVLPIVLHNFLIDFASDLIQYVMTKINEGDHSVLIQTTGLGAWLFVTVNFGAVVSVILGAVSLKFVLKLIPFVRV